MSAFFGLIHLDGKPVDLSILQKVQEYFLPIGPDEQGTWAEGQIGVCWAKLQTGNAVGADNQPFAQNMRYSLVGDIRIDGRGELLAKLTAKGEVGLENAADSELVLRAWMLWNEQLVDYLIGDFSIAIWDKQKKTMFCLRDHIGVQRFYYAQLGKVFIFSNILNSFHFYPQFPTALNDQAIIDFLVFAYNLEFDTTTFKNILQLAPAHYMSASNKGININRYWHLPVDELLRYPKLEDYVEHFKELLNIAVTDRLPSGNCSVAMSGGLDSTSIAACANAQQTQQQSLSIFTLDIKSFWPEDEEVEYAKLVANKLKAEFHQMNCCSDDLFGHKDNTNWLIPEPSRDSFQSVNLAMAREMALGSKVGLTGQGADALLMPSFGHLGRLRKNKQWGRLAMDAGRHALLFGQRPPLNIKAALKQKYEQSPWRPAIPRWLNREVLSKINFEERFNNKINKIHSKGETEHPERPEAYMDLSSSVWPAILHRFEPQSTGQAIVFRHPYFDIRLLRFVLAMPAMPWFYRKEILRRAMIGKLPETVRLRQKTVPRISPVYNAIKQLTSAERQAQLANLEKLSPYMDVTCIQNILENVNMLKSNEADLVVLPLALSRWMRRN